MLLLSACATTTNGLIPESDAPYEALTDVTSVTYETVQVILPDTVLTDLADAMPVSVDKLEFGGFFAPEPAKPPTCASPDYYVLAGTSSPTDYVVLNDCVSIQGTVVAVEWPRQSNWTWWHDTFYIVPDQTGYTNQFSTQMPLSWPTATVTSIKVEQAQGFELPAIGQRVVATGVWTIDLNWGFPAIINGEGQCW